MLLLFQITLLELNRVKTKRIKGKKTVNQSGPMLNQRKENDPRNVQCLAVYRLGIA